jgi:hypothetical protein
VPATAEEAREEADLFSGFTIVASTAIHAIPSAMARERLWLTNLIMEKNGRERTSI